MCEGGAPGQAGAGRLSVLPRHAILPGMWVQGLGLSTEGRKVELIERLKDGLGLAD